MKDIEAILDRKKANIEQLEVPEDLELRLRKALTRKKPQKKRGLIAVALVMFLFFSYNFDAIAYYGKKFIGYDEVINGALKDLNEMGQGQEIYKSYTFSNGLEVTLEGIMFDDNQLVAFYSIKGDKEKLGNLSNITMKGLFSYYMSSGSGIMNDSRTEIKWVSNFEPPKFFERNLSFQFSMEKEDSAWEHGEIEFKLDRSKAMGTTIKQSIKQKIELGDNIVNFANITASPTVTIIEGSIDTNLDLYRNSLNNIHPNFQIDFELYANGQKIEKKGSGLSSSLKGYTFEGRFEALSKDIEKLELKLVGLTSSKVVDKVITLNNKENIKLLDRDVTIKQLDVEDEATYITIITDEDVLLEKVYLLIGDDRVPLERTIATPGGLTKHPDGTLTYERTLQFMGQGDNLKLEIGKIRSLEKINETIDIPLD